MQRSWTRGVKRRRVAANLVERQQPVIAIEGRVLDPFGHDGAAHLLKAQNEVAARGTWRVDIDEQLAQVGNGVGQIRPRSGGCGAHLVEPRQRIRGWQVTDAHVGPIDRHVRQELAEGTLEICGSQSQTGVGSGGGRSAYQAKQLRAQQLVDDQTFGFELRLGQTPGSAGAAPQLV
ncbi:MAG: hypothetical protein WKF82_07100 [Nocardioidaceae bacterium]